MDTSNPFLDPLHKQSSYARDLMLMTTLAAIWLALYPFLAIGARFVTAVIAMTYLFGCHRTRQSVLVILPCLYVPYGWLLWGSASQWSDYHRHWLGIWPQLPGLLIEATVHPLNEFWFQFVTAGASVLFFLASIALGRINRYCLAGVAVLTLVASVAWSCATYQIYRA